MKRCPASVAVVEGGGVEAVQALHPVGQRRLTAFDHEVEVVAHEAPRVAAPTEPLDHSRQDREEEEPIVVVHEDRAAVNAARGDVPDPVAEGRAQRSRHEPTVRDGAVRDQWPRETCLPEPRPGASPWPCPSETCLCEPRPGPAPGRVPPRPVSASRVRGQPLAVSRRGLFERERLPQLARATRRATSDGASVWARATARYQRGMKNSPLPVSTAATIRSPTNAGLTTAR